MPPAGSNWPNRMSSAHLFGRRCGREPRDRRRPVAKPAGPATRAYIFASVDVAIISLRGPPPNPRREENDAPGYFVPRRHGGRASSPSGIKRRRSYSAHRPRLRIED